MCDNTVSAQRKKKLENVTSVMKCWLGRLHEKKLEESSLVILIASFLFAF